MLTKILEPRYMNVLKKINLTPLHLMACTQMMLGIVLIYFPERGATTILDDLYRIPIPWFGLAMFMAGCYMFTEITVHQFIILSLPFLMFVVAIMVWAFISPGAQPTNVIVYSAFYIIILKMVSAWSQHEPK